MKKALFFVFLATMVFLTACSNKSGDSGQQSNPALPPVQKEEPAQLETESSDNETNNLVLGPGTYVVGEDIPAGKYDCIAESGFGVLRGDVASAGPAGFVQTMGNSTSSAGEYSATVEGADSYSNLTLEDGDTIYIEMSLNVEFVEK